MADVISNEDGQLMLLAGFVIVLGVVVYTTILNNMIFSSNMESTGLEVSKQDIRDFRTLTESEIRMAAYYSNTSVVNNTNLTEVQDYFFNYTNSYISTIKTMYSARGASVEIILNNVTFNRTNSSINETRFYVDRKNHTFPNGSLIIPMDSNQTNLMKVYGLVYKILDDTGTAPLNSTNIPVWEILQNPVNSSVPDFYANITTDDNASSAVVDNVSLRAYSGGPFIVDKNNITEAQRQLILAEAKNKSIAVHELFSDFTYNFSVELKGAPRVAAYPDPPGTVMESYYEDGEVPYTALGNTDIYPNGNLSQFDILTIPHQNMAGKPANVINEIIGWVTNGGILNVQCEGVDTMDDAVESVAPTAKPWYGFVGISKSDSIADSGIKLLDNSTRYNASYSYNASPPMPLSGLSDPGAPYNPLTQTSNTSGIFGITGGSTTAFSLRENASQVNPDTNILGYASNASGYPVYGNYDSDGVSELQLTYVQAPYDNGLVTYIAGHNLSERDPSGSQLLFETFFAASMKRQAVTIVTAKTINVTIKYYDDKVKYEDTFLINI